MCAKEVSQLQTDLMTRMTLLRDAVHSNTTVPTAQVFVSDFCGAIAIKNLLLEIC